MANTCACGQTGDHDCAPWDTGGADADAMTAEDTRASLAPERCRRHQSRMRVLPQRCFECEALAGNPMFKGYKEPALPNPLNYD